MKYTGLGVTLNENFLRWGTQDTRCTHCYICGFKLGVNPDNIRELNEEVDHVLEFFLSAGLMGHFRAALFRRVHKRCNNPIKSSPGGQHLIQGAPANSGLLGWGVLSPPYINYDGLINYWKINRARADLLRNYANTAISRLGLKDHEGIRRSDITTYEEVIQHLNEFDYTPGYAQNEKKLHILTNPDFRRSFIKQDKYDELIKLLHVKLIDKFIYGLIVSTCMHVNPDNDTLNRIFRDLDFRRAVQNVLGPYYEGSTIGGPSGAGPSSGGGGAGPSSGGGGAGPSSRGGGAGPSSRGGAGFGKRRKYLLKRLRMDLKKVT